MKQNKLQRLSALIEQIEIINPDRETMYIHEFQKIEEIVGCKLPDDYKYFCQELGSGRASGFIDLYCMSNKAICDSFQVTSEIIDRINSSSMPKEEKDEYTKLLKKALIFASFNDDRVILWDLRIYDSDTDGYDMYWCDIYAPDSCKPVNIGCDFTNFLCDFCYGQLACSMIPGFCAEGEPMSVEYIFG
jgi:hypothetical protein